MSTSHSHHSPEVEPASGLDIVSVSDRNPRVRTIRIVRPESEDATFLKATTKGLAITFRHFIRNVLGRMKPLKERGKGGAPGDVKGNEIETVQYPEEKVQYPDRFRGLHRLMLREDGEVRCVACMLCPTVCPANCITIVPEETANQQAGQPRAGKIEVIEKRPAIFEIDELRCVVCGLCVEACPCDAIRMDTGIHAPPVEERGDAIEDKASMMARGIASTAIQGGAGPTWREKK
jgi:NADH-quinone oxidoreductase subunit I